MGSSNNLVLLIMVTISLMLVADTTQENQEIPSGEKKKGLERQLKAINKPPIKTFKTKHGEIFDCIDIHKQLAFDHHLLKNHSVQVKPTTVPKWITRNNISQKVGPFHVLQEGINCPEGTVIVKRTTMQDLIHEQRLKSIGFSGPRHFLPEGKNTDLTGYHFATASYEDTVYGIKGNLNLWDPQVFQHQVSLASMAIGGGRNEHFASITVGWMVNPLLYQDHIHLYTYWTADGYNKTGCYDIRCPGFVQVSQRIPLGVLLQPVSVYNGIQKEMDLSLHQDHNTGDWWLIFGGTNVGYWPKSLFIDSGLVKGAHLSSWGGQVYSPIIQRSPLMGSGHFPKEGFGKAAFINGINIIDDSGQTLIPQIFAILTHQSSPNCYKAKYVHDDAEPWFRAVYYGGPGGCTG